MSADQVRQAVTARLRATADTVSRLTADDRWRLQAAYDMGCLTIDVGTGPVGRHRDSGPVDASNFRVVLADLQALDSRVTVQRFEHDAVGWVEEIALPLDNPALIDQVTRWIYHLAFHRVADETDLAAIEAEQAASTGP
jgi:hypothetical protein